MLKKITQDELIPTLCKAGIKAKEYSRPGTIGNPLEFFFSTASGGRGILIKKGIGAKLQIAVDNKHRQAVLHVVEGKRKMERKVIVPAKDQKEASYTALARHGLVIPGAKFTISKIKKVGISPVLRKNKYEVTVTASVDKITRNTFLLGMDETSHFISVLPEKVNSVEEAHQLLRPEGVPEGALRQGEFFFVPVEDDVKIDEKKIRRSVPLEQNSNHHAQYAIPKERLRQPTYPYNTYYSGATYVKGLIYDKRGYRHAPLDLGDKWHKVVRNREKQVVLNPTRRVRYD